MTTTPELFQEPVLATQIARLWPPQGRWTEADYLGLPDTNQIVELAQGNIIVMPPPTTTHQRLVANLYRALYGFITQQEIGVLYFAPFAVRLRPRLIREPDLVFYTHAHTDRIGEHISGVPDLAVEVISPSSRQIDERDKFVEYAQAGIAEYWLVDPEAQTTAVYAPDQDGAYALVSQAGGEGQVHSQLLAGLVVEMAAVFA